MRSQSAPGLLDFPSVALCADLPRRSEALLAANAPIRVLKCQYSLTFLQAWRIMIPTIRTHRSVGGRKFQDSMILRVETQSLRMLKELGMRLRAERRRRGLKQAELAQAASVSRPTVIAAEAGRGVSSQSLAAMMGVLALDFAHLSAPTRPPRKDLMRPERKRQTRRRVPLETAFPSIARDEVEPYGKRITNTEVAQTVEQQPRRRPLLKELMTAERLRRDRLDMKARRERT